jgi:hypothetical protein
MTSLRALALIAFASVLLTLAPARAWPTGFAECAADRIAVETTIVDIMREIPDWDPPNPSSYGPGIVTKAGAAFRALGRATDLTPAQKNQVWEYFVGRMSKWSKGRWGARPARGPDGSYLWWGEAGKEVVSVLMITPRGDVYKGLIARPDPFPADYLPPLEWLDRLVPDPRPND